MRNCLCRLLRKSKVILSAHKRKHFSDGSKYLDKDCKIIYVKNSDMWKLYWMRADLKWHLYEEYQNLDELLEEVKKDPNGCFWG